MFRTQSIIVLALVFSFGCFQETQVEDPIGEVNPQGTESSQAQMPSAVGDVESPVEAEGEISDSAINEPRERRKVGKGDLDKPLDDRVQEVLPAKIKRNPEGEPTVLHLKGYGVSQSDLAQISLYTKLTELHIGSNDLSDEDLHYFSQLKNLRLLGIRRNPRITGSTFGELAQLTALEELYVADCSLQPDFFKELSASQSLRLLGLRSYSISESWIDALCTINTLEEIHLNTNDITPDQIKSLERCIPGVLIETHEPRKVQSTE